MLENLKGILILLIITIVVGLLGYWAVRTIEPADISIERQKVAELSRENADLLNQIADLKGQIEKFKDAEPPTTDQPVATQPTPPAPQPTAPTTYKYQSLISALQKLIDDKVYMKLGSSGTRVGTVQTFLNLYNNTNNKVDNDYGATTKTAVIKFQTAVGLPATGQAGPLTFQKMIDWLKKQG